MDIENYNDGQEEVVDPQEEIKEENVEGNENDDSEKSNESGKVQEVAEPVEDDKSQSQSEEDNSAYRKMRLKAKEEARAELESERQKIEAEKAEISNMMKQRAAQETEQKIRMETLTENNINKVMEDNYVERDVAIKLLEGDVQKLIADERIKANERYTKINMQKEAKKSDPFYNLINNKVDQLIYENPNVDYETAYNYYVGQNYTELQKELSKRTEQQTIANVQDRSKRKVINGSNGNNEANPNQVISKKSLGMAAAFGLDTNELAKGITKRRLNKRK